MFDLDNKHFPVPMEGRDALWSLFEQRGKELVRVSPLELPYKQALALWADTLLAHPLGKAQYQSKLRPVTLTAAGKLTVSDWQKGVDNVH